MGEKEREPCPHCGTVSGPGAPSHVCPDHNRWTQAEKDEWRVQVRRWHPQIEFRISSVEFGRRFGERNRLDREAEAAMGPAEADE